MAVVIVFVNDASNFSIAANGTITVTGITTSGPGWILVKSGVGNNHNAQVSAVSVAGNAGALLRLQIMPDGTSHSETWGYFSPTALTGASVVVTYDTGGFTGAGGDVHVNFASGTDASSIGNVNSASGTSGTSTVSVAASANNSVMFGGALNFGGTDTAGANTNLLDASSDGVGDFICSVNNTQTTSSGTSYSITTTHTSDQWAMEIVEIKPASAGGGVTTLDNEAVTRRPRSHGSNARQRHTWTAQPLQVSQPLKSFLDSERTDRRPAGTPRHSANPWDLTAISAVTLAPWRDLAPPVRAPPWMRSRVIRPDASLRALGQSSPVRTILPSDEMQVIRPRRIRRWAPMGALARATAAAVEIFPFAPDVTGRFLANAQGAPVPIIGRTAWGIQTLSAADRAEFLDDTVARGYTAIECQIPGNLPNIFNNPFDCNGNLPFIKLLDGSTWTSGSFAGSKPDLSTPNPPFWANADDIVADCRSRRLQMYWFSAYLGIDSGEGWRDTMTANGDPATVAYGTFIANRYKPQPHIVWCTAGDTASGFDPENDLITGIQAVSSQRSGPQFSAERNGGSISSDGSGALGAAMTLNGAYGWPDAIAMCRRAYAFGTTTRAIPAYLIEGPYDQEGPDGTGVNTLATQPVRRWPWWAIIETIGGFIQGNGYIWRFAPSGTPLATDNWKNHKGTQTTQDITRLAAFWKSIAWWTLVPSGQGSIGTLITSGVGTVDNANYVAAACNPAGTLWVAYAGPSRASTIDVDMTKMSGTALARWWNPTTAAFTTVGSFANTGTHTFTWPGDNGSGFSDWVLVMTA